MTCSSRIVDTLQGRWSDDQSGGRAGGSLQSFILVTPAWALDLDPPVIIRLPLRSLRSVRRCNRSGGTSLKDFLLLKSLMLAFKPTP
jgi:hypothetical protein